MRNSQEVIGEVAVRQHMALYKSVPLHACSGQSMALVPLGGLTKTRPAASRIRCGPNARHVLEGMPLQILSNSASVTHGARLRSYRLLVHSSDVPSQARLGGTEVFFLLSTFMPRNADSPRARG